MAAPVYQAHTIRITGTTSVTVPWPAHAIDDVGLLLVETANQPVTLTTANGFAEPPSSPQGTGTAAGVASTRLTAYLCRATSGAMASPVVGCVGGNHLFGTMITFRGCKTTGDPWNAISGAVLAAASTACSIAGPTTSVADCLIVNIVANATDTTTAQTGNMANAALTGILERYDFSNTGGNGGGIGISTGVKATAGAVGNTTCTLATSSVQGKMSIALEPTSNNITVTPGLGASVFAGLAPTILITVKIAIGLGAPVFAGFAPSVQIAQVVQPGTGAVVFTGQSPAVVIGAAQVVQPGTGAPVFTGFAPAVLVTVKIPTGLGQPVFTGIAPTVAVSNNQSVLSGLGEPVFTGFAPSVVASISASPGLGQPVFSGFAPLVVLSDNPIISVGLGETTFAGFAPTVAVGPGAGPVLATPGRGQWVFTGFAPTVYGYVPQAIARHVLTVSRGGRNTGTVSIHRRRGTSVMDAYTADSTLITADSTLVRADSAPMGTPA